jgi:hypothetical protein
VDRLVDGVPDRRLEPAAQDRDEHDKSRTYHERGRRDRCPLGVACRVPGREPSLAAEPAHHHSEDGDHRLHEVDHRQRDRDEEDQCPARQDDKARREDRVTGDPEPDHDRGQREEKHGQNRPPPATASRLGSCVPKRRQRRHAHGPDGRQERCEHGDTEPDGNRPHDRSGLHDGPDRRDAQAEFVEEPCQRGREAHPTKNACCGCEHADDQSLAQDHEQRLPPGGPQGPQDPELLRPLRHRDRVGVEDDEGADEDGHETERQQEVVEEAQVARDVVGLLSGVRCSGLNGQVAGDDRPDLLHKRGVVDAAVTRDVDSSRLAVEMRPVLDIPERGQHDAGATDAGHVAELHDARDRDGMKPGKGGQLQTLSDGEVLVLCRLLVHGACPSSGGP